MPRLHLLHLLLCMFPEERGSTKHPTTLSPLPYVSLENTTRERSTRVDGHSSDASQELTTHITDILLLQIWNTNFLGTGLWHILIQDSLYLAPKSPRTALSAVPTKRQDHSAAISPFVSSVAIRKRFLSGIVQPPIETII
ncbi:hypothetical protein KCU85_g335, partial [Aureobasidium melanogenum]